MRESGILMPVSSLPGPYGIGCFGKAAFQFVDFLSAAGQTIWQLLPLSPTGYGDSPYQSCSAFAGNPYFVDLEALEKEGLLTAADLKAESWGKNPLEVDYGTLYVSRFAVLRKAYAAWRSQCAGLHGCAYYYPDDYYAFTLANEDWLEDYALYMALKVANKMKNWVEWDAPYRRRDKAVLAAFAAANEEEIGFWKFVQYKFSAQWQAVKTYANKKGVQILGDIPIYVSADSVDAWVGGALFELDADGGFARVRVHTDRRGVDDHARVGVAVEVIIIIRPVAGDDRHMRAELLEHGLNGRGRAAVAEHERLLPRNVDAAVTHEILEAEGVGIIAIERAVRPADEHVHAAELLRDRRELGAVRDDRLFIRDGHVERVKIAAGQKRRQVLRRDLIEPVGIVRELRVDGRRVAVAELFAQKSAPHHHTTSR